MISTGRQGHATGIRFRFGRGIAGKRRILTAAIGVLSVAHMLWHVLAAALLAHFVTLP
jgi:hypothetical protein